MDLYQFIRRLKLRVWFHDKKPTQSGSDFGAPVFRLNDLHLNVKSDFLPMIQCPAIETYINLVKSEVECLKQIENNKPLSHPNLSSAEIQALQELDQNQNLTIKSADKGGGVVVMDTVNYISEITRQLSDSDVYKVLSGDPKWDFERKIQQIVQDAKSEGIIDERLSEYLIMKHPKNPCSICPP